MESNRSGLFVYYRWLLLLLASGLCLFPAVGCVHPNDLFETAFVDGCS